MRRVSGAGCVCGRVAGLCGDIDTAAKEQAGSSTYTASEEFFMEAHPPFSIDSGTSFSVHIEDRNSGPCDSYSLYWHFTKIRDLTPEDAKLSSGLE